MDNQSVSAIAQLEIAMRKVLFVLLMLASYASIAADLFDRYEPRQFRLADQLEPNATIGGYPIWNAENRWRLYEVLRSDSTGVAMPVPLGTVNVFQTEEKKFVATMSVKANLAQGSANDWTDEPCKRNDMLFKSSLGGTFKDINCVTINHITDYYRNPSGKAAELFALLKKDGVDIPPTVLRLTFTRYSGGQRWLSVTLTINPELAGFPRESESWGRSSWNKSQAFSDPAKKRFIDLLGVWAMQFAKQMDVAFEKKHDAFISVPSWRSTLNAQSTGTPQLAKPSKEEQLTELKRLFDKGLITHAVYLEKQKLILEAN
jgi:hypothetical protein